MLPCARTAILGAPGMGEGMSGCGRGRGRNMLVMISVACQVSSWWDDAGKISLSDAAATGSRRYHRVLLS